MTHDLTVRPREELKELIKEANEKEQQDETGSFMHRIRGPPWIWRIKKIARNKYGMNKHIHKRKKKRIECRSYERR